MSSPSFTGLDQNRSWYPLRIDTLRWPAPAAARFLVPFRFLALVLFNDSKGT